MTTKASKRYAEAIQRLRTNNPEDYRAIISRVESWKTLANKWQAQAQGKPELPTATQWRKKHERAQFIISMQAKRIEDLEAQQATTATTSREW